MRRLPDRWLTKQRAAVHARCSVRTLERAIAAGELHAGRTPSGGRVRIRLDELDGWLERDRHPTR